MQRPSSDRTSSLSRYLRDIRGFAPLTRESERALAHQARSGLESHAAHRLVESNLGFVVGFAARYRRFGVPFEDLLNEGNLGLLEAASHFDPSHDVKFISFAVWWIRKYILRALRRHSGAVRLPPSQMKKIRQVQEARCRLAGLLGREPARHELSREAGVPAAKLDRILETGTPPVSLDARPADGRIDVPILDRLPDRRAKSPEDEMIRNENRRRVQSGLVQLGDRERAVLAHRFGLEGAECLTLEEIGRRLGLSREAVRLIERKALKRLRHRIGRRQGVSLRENPMNAPGHRNRKLHINVTAS